MNLPNKLTVLRMVLIVPFVAVMMLNRPWAGYWATALFLLASVTDFLDGHIARSRGLVTDFGKLMDPIADKLLVMSALIGLTAQGRANAVCVIILLGREFVISGIRLVAAGKGTLIAADWSGKVKTVTQMIAVSLLLLRLGGAWDRCGTVLLWASAAISIWSLALYVLRNKEVIAK